MPTVVEHGQCWPQSKSDSAANHGLEIHQQANGFPGIGGVGLGLVDNNNRMAFCRSFRLKNALDAGLHVVVFTAPAFCRFQLIAITDQIGRVHLHEVNKEVHVFRPAGRGAW